jgi:hypothetical protein
MSARTSTELSQYFNYRPLTQDQRALYEQQGYLVLPQILTEKGLELARQQCMKAWGNEKKSYSPDATWLKNALLQNIHHQAQIVRDYYFNGPLVDVAEQLIGPNIKSVTSQLTFKMRGNTKPFPWHQDNGYGELDPYNAVSTLTALDDANEDNGCLWLIPGSHLQGQFDLKRTNDDIAQGNIIDLDIDDNRSVAMPVKAGDCLLFNCWMLHKSDGNFAADRDRRILYMRYADADAVEVYNDNQPRLGRLLRGETRFDAVRQYEAAMD